MRQFKRVCVYCGSSDDVPERYFHVARAVGHELARRGVGVVYGGGRVGLMGAVADGALAAGGEVVGVIPHKLEERELAHRGLTELIVVESMHARKTVMAHLSGAFIALPGGWGTLEEIFEVTTWTQLQLHTKPVGLLNAHGYYDHLLAFLSQASAEGFIRPAHRGLMQAHAEIGPLLQALAAVPLPAVEVRKPPPP